MTRTKLILTLLFMTGLGILALKAQHSVNTAGGNVLNTSGSVSYSVGQIVYSSHVDENGSVSEGVQHPYEIYVITIIDEPGNNQPMLSVFPNPVADQLSLMVVGRDNCPQSDYHYQLLDINGKSLKAERMMDDITLIDMGGKMPGTYFLKVTASEGKSWLFKIIKK